MVLSYLIPILLLASTNWSLLGTASSPSMAHFTLSRRGGSLATREAANLTYLHDLVLHTERRYGRTKRQVKGNRLTRRWKSSHAGTEVDEDLLIEPGQHGRWFFNLPVGEQPNLIEVDLDMLSPDFYTLLTTSGRGSRYNVFAKSHVANNVHVHPLCLIPTDTIHLTDLTNAASIPIQLPMCKPSKSSRYTLSSSGSVLGLGPSTALARLHAPSLLDQLILAQTLTQNLFSLTLLDAQSGVLTLGGTIAYQVEEAKLRTSIEFDNLGNPAATPASIDAQVAVKLAESFPTSLEGQFRWLDVQGADGWWTTLMSGVWINGAKILRNQPVLLDLQSPFILAPPLAARRFYESIGGAKRLPAPHDAFYAFPCLNRLNIAFEFAGGGMFPSLSGEGTVEEALWGPAGGKLSLGKLGVGTGYCVGVVVETRIGVKEVEMKGMLDHGGAGGTSDRNEWAGSGMRDVWVMGEPFFRGLGVAFDLDKKRIGFRTY